VVKDTRIFIHSDEVYEHLIFDQIPHQSILRYPDLLERSFVSFSFGKVYHCTGWKLGYSVSSPGPDAGIPESTPVQLLQLSYAFAGGLARKYLTNKESYLGLGAFVQQKRDYFGTLMAQTKFTPLPSYGSYFQLYKYDRISDESDKDFAIRITKEYGVASDSRVGILSIGEG
jgi:methionine aminotransferase